MLRPEGDRQRKRAVVLSHAGEANAGPRASIKAREIFLSKSARELSGAVCAEVKEDHAVAIINSRYGLIIISDNNDGFDEFIRHAFAVGFQHPLNRVAARAAFAVPEQAISLLRAIPSLVAVHRVVAAY